MSHLARAVAVDMETVIHNYIEVTQRSHASHRVCPRLYALAPISSIDTSRTTSAQLSLILLAH
jgi:hypothetical protein